MTLSFLRKRANLDGLRTLVNTQSHRADLIAKIERPETLDDIDSILDATNANGASNVDAVARTAGARGVLRIGNVRGHDERCKASFADHCGVQ